MNCYETIDRMGDELEGRLPPPLRAGFDEHLHECRPCRTYLEQLRLTVRTLDHLPRPTGTSARRSQLLETFKRETGQGR